MLTSGPTPDWLLWFHMQVSVEPLQTFEPCHPTLGTGQLTGKPQGSLWGVPQQQAMDYASVEGIPGSKGVHHLGQWSGRA